MLQQSVTGIAGAKQPQDRGDGGASRCTAPRTSEEKSGQAQPRKSRKLPKDARSAAKVVKPGHTMFRGESERPGWAKSRAGEVEPKQVRLRTGKGGPMSAQ